MFCEAAVRESEGGWLQAEASLIRLSASCNYHAGFEEPILPFQLQGRAEILMKKGSLSAGPASTAFGHVLRWPLLRCLSLDGFGVLLRAWGASFQSLANLNGENSQLPACLRTHGTNSVESQVLWLGGPSHSSPNLLT